MSKESNRLVGFSFNPLVGRRLGALSSTGILAWSQLEGSLQTSILKYNMESGAPTGAGP